MPSPTMDLKIQTIDPLQKRWKEKTRSRSSELIRADPAAELAVEQVVELEAGQVEGDLASENDQGQDQGREKEGEDPYLRLKETRTRNNPL